MQLINVHQKRRIKLFSITDSSGKIDLLQYLCDGFLYGIIFQLNGTI